MKAVKIPLKQLNNVRKELMQKKNMDMNYKIKTDQDYGYIPIIKNDDSYEIIDTLLEPIKKQPRNFKELLEDTLNKNEINDLKNSFDVIGDIVIVEIPPNLNSKKKVIGKATLKFSKKKSVYMKKSKIQGITRIRDLELIAGVQNPITIHKEHNTRLKLNIEKMYFSPRLATERKRISDDVMENEKILDMFCGIGPFSCIIAKNNNVKITGVDINKQAIQYFKENIKLNKLKNIKPINGDIKEVYKDLKSSKFNRIIMNLPGLAYNFLEQAFNLIADNGIINYYEFSDSYNTGIKRIKNTASQKNKKIKIINTRKVKSTSPGQWHIAIDAKINPK